MESFHDHLKFLRKKAVQLRLDSLKATYKAKVGYSGSMLSAMDILVALYYGKLYDRPLLNYDPQKPGSEEQDYFVLSKGHISAAWYAILADVGFFDKAEMKHLYQMNGLLPSHPVKKTPGVAIGSASLAHGFSGALGLAMALKADRLPNKVFCLMGDGELQEGQIWEAALAAAHYRLDNLIGIVDVNGLQVDAPIRGVIGVDPIADKFEAFGFKTIPVRDGHDYEELLSAFDKALEVQRRPAVIIARTVPGKGVGFLENKSYYHAFALSEQEMGVVVPALELELAQLNQNL